MRCISGEPRLWLPSQHVRVLADGRSTVWGFPVIGQLFYSSLLPSV